MSEIINNRQYRQKVLKELIMELHNGKSAEEVKERFAKLIEGISASEISEMEQSLIMEGMPVSEVQRLCDVHAAVFKGSIEDIHKEEKQLKPQDIPGHPINTFFTENRAIEKLIEETIKTDINNFKGEDAKQNILKLIEDINLLMDIDKHYSRKENLIFPYLEKYGITAPPKVMWGVDDEIRDGIKNCKKFLVDYHGNSDEVISKLDEILDRCLEMIFKEENILFPMCIDTISQDEWISIMKESDEIGYCIIEPLGVWKPERAAADAMSMINANESSSNEYLKLPTGILTIKEIQFLLNTIPIDITFIDKDDVVKYFSQGRERIFARTKAVIGRKVQNCHPPASVHIIEKLLEDFKTGKKDSEDFWIRMGPNYIFIRYFAVRDEKGEYIGTLEATQNINHIKALTGEKRLVTD